MHAAIDALYLVPRERGLVGEAHAVRDAVLSSHMEAYERDVERRALAKKQTSDMQRELVQHFMTRSNYYYSPVTEMFFAYTSGFVPVTHDYVCMHIHEVLTERLHDLHEVPGPRLIMKEIRERNIVNAIPTSATIQSVIGLFMRGDGALSKNDVKYFMTVMGDCILKKNALATFSRLG